MKKNLLLLICFLSLAGFLPVRATDFWEDFPEELEQEIDSKEAIVFADPGYTQATSQFAPGQSIYLRLEADGSGDQEKTLRLLDSAKKTINQFTLNQSGSGPYYYTLSLTAPGQPGIYYLDIKIKSGRGFSWAGQENITVGQSSGSVSVTSEAKSVTGQESGCGCGQQKSPSPSVATSAAPRIYPSATPVARPSITPEPEMINPPASLWKIFQERLARFFARLSGLLK
ncbi:MAG TPA: hypothetical protein VMW41_05530 [Candidatus Bathyarchaeia archaeon]|nr:hypothetical protein [Candidatus Bathyarchaeia archaeon]